MRGEERHLLYLLPRDTSLSPTLRIYIISSAHAHTLNQTHSTLNPIITCLKKMSRITYLQICFICRMWRWNRNKQVFKMAPVKKKKKKARRNPHLHKPINPNIQRNSSHLQYHRAHNQDSPPGPRVCSSDSMPSSMRADGLYNFMTDACILSPVLCHFNTKGQKISKIYTRQDRKEIKKRWITTGGSMTTNHAVFLQILVKY